MIVVYWGTGSLRVPPRLCFNPGATAAAPSAGFMNHKMAMGIDFYGHAHHVRYYTAVLDLFRSSSI